MLNVVVLYNFVKIDSFDLSFYDPFALVNGTRGYVHVCELFDDTSIQDVLNIIERRLKNVHKYPLRICMSEFNGTAYAVKDHKGQPIRYILRDGNIMDTLIHTMNFTPIYYEPKDGARFGKIFKNGTITGCLKEVELDKTDIVGNMCPVINLGQKNSEFLTPIEEYKFAFLTPYSAPKFVVTFFNVFSWQFHLTWFISFILLVLLWTCMQKYDKRTSFDILDVTLMVFGISIAAPQRLLKPSYSRMLYITWSMLSLINISLYGATMVEHLTRGKVSTNLERMRDLQYNKLKILVHHGVKDVIKDMAQSDAAPDYYKDLYKRQILIDSTEEGLERVAKKKDAVMMYTLLLAQFQKLYSQYKDDLYVLNSGPPSRFSSHLVPTTSPYKSEFDKIYQRITESGLMPKWSDEMLQYTSDRIKRERKDYSDDAVYTMRELEFIFQTFGACCAVCFLVFCLEVLVHQFVIKKDCDDVDLLFNKAN